MVRLVRHGAMLAALACGGLGLMWTGLLPGQQPKTNDTWSPSGAQGKNTPSFRATATAAIPADRILTVHENGKTLRCQLISTWRLPDGSPAYQAQVIDTGEMLTLVEDGPATNLDGRRGKMRATSTKIFHWARSNTPPPGAPVPPGVLASVPAGQTIISEPGAGPVVIAEGPSRLVEVTSGNPVPVSMSMIPVAQTKPGLLERFPANSGPSSASASPEETSVTTPQTALGPPALSPEAPPPPTIITESPPVYVEVRPQPRLSERVISAPQLDPCPPDYFDPCLPPATSPRRPSVVRNLKREWQAQWGEGLFTKNQQPGKSTVQQAPLLPPAPTPADQKDVLLNPGRTALTEDKVPGRSRPNDDGRPNDPRIPLGAQSVLAAKNGVVNQMTYVPVPIVTVPQPYRPPVPPPPSMPKAPEPNAYTNAFSQPPAPKTQPATPPIQPGLPMGSRPEFLPPTAPPGQAMMPQAMMPMPYAMPYPPFAYGRPPGMFPGGMAPSPVTGAMGPFGPYPVAQMNHPNIYRGPLPPSPLAYQPPMPISMPMMQPQMPYSYGQPPVPMLPAPQAAFQSPQPGVASSGEPAILEQLVILRDSFYPAQRELAAEALAAADWRQQPQIVDMLLVAARHDPAASVRAACCRCLARMNLTSQPVIAALTALKSDADPRVRAEAEQALARLTASPPAAAIQPARGQ